MRTDWSPRAVSPTRRRFLQSNAAATLSVLAPGFAGANSHSRQDPGVVWSQRDASPGTQHLFDIVQSPEDTFTCCGDSLKATIITVTDHWGRRQKQRNSSPSNEWGDRGYELLALDDELLLAGIDSGAPRLVRLEAPFDTVWSRSYDGTPDGAVHAATTSDGHAVGWTQAGDSAGAIVVGTDGAGNEQWSDRMDDGRRLTELVSTEATSASLVAVGSYPSPSGSGWATIWQADGTRDRDLTFETPGDGPDAAVADGAAVVLAGTSSDGWWLQRRASDWSVDWTRTYAADGRNRGVDDLVTQGDGYGLLTHDVDGTVVLRTDGQGEERWRGRYAPYTEGNDLADRGHAMVPVDGDEFVVAGVTSPGEDDRDWWVGRVGEPEATTPADIPEQTDTPGPTCCLTTTPSPAGTRTPESPTVSSEGSPSSTSTPGFGILAAIGGLAGWLAMRRRDD